MNERKAPSLVTISVFTLVTIFLWTVSGVVKLLNQTAAVSVERETLQALSPELNGEALERLPDRVFFSDSEIGTLNLDFVNTEPEAEEEEVEVEVEESPQESEEEATPSASVESDTTP